MVSSSTSVAPRFIWSGIKNKHWRRALIILHAIRAFRGNKGSATVSQPSQDYWETNVLLEGVALTCRMERNFDDCGCGPFNCGMPPGTKVEVKFSEMFHTEPGSVAQRPTILSVGTKGDQEYTTWYISRDSTGSKLSENLVILPHERTIVLRESHSCCGNTDNCCNPIAGVDEPDRPNYWRHCWLTAKDDEEYERIITALGSWAKVTFEETVAAGADATGIEQATIARFRDLVAAGAGTANQADSKQVSPPPELTAAEIAKAEADSIASSAVAFWILGLVPAILLSVCLVGPAFYLETSNCQLTSGPLPKPSASLFNKGNTTALPGYWNTKWIAYTGYQQAIPDDPNTYKPSLTMPVGNEAGLCTESLTKLESRIVCSRRGGCSKNPLHYHWAGCIEWSDADTWKDFDAMNLANYGTKTNLVDVAQGMVRGYEISLAGMIAGWVGFGLLMSCICAFGGDPNTPRYLVIFDLFYYGFLMAMSVLALQGYNLSSSFQSEQWKSVFPDCQVSVTQGPTYGVLIFNLLYLSIMLLSVLIVDLACGVCKQAPHAESVRVPTDEAQAPTTTTTNNNNNTQADTHQAARSKAAKATAKAARRALNRVMTKGGLGSQTKAKDGDSLQADAVDIEMPPTTLTGVAGSGDGDVPLYRG